jgi:hypothetical protein
VSSVVPVVLFLKTGLLAKSYPTPIAYSLEAGRANEIRSGVSIESGTVHTQYNKLHDEKPPLYLVKNPER